MPLCPGFDLRPRRGDRRPASRDVRGRSSRYRPAEELDHLAVGKSDAAVWCQARDGHSGGGRLGDQRRPEPDPTGRSEACLGQPVLDRAAADARRIHRVTSASSRGASPPSRLASFVIVPRSSRMPWTAPSSR